MLNNKGQILVLFVLLIPIFLLILVLVIDIGNISYEKSALNNICNLASKENKLDNNKLIEFIKLNDDKINNITIDDNSITLEKKVPGILSQIIDIKIYNIKTTCKIERNN